MWIMLTVLAILFHNVKLKETVDHEDDDWTPSNEKFIKKLFNLKDEDNVMDATMVYQSKEYARAKLIADFLNKQSKLNKTNDFINTKSKNQKSIDIFFGDKPVVRERYKVENVEKQKIYNDQNHQEINHDDQNHHQSIVNQHHDPYINEEHHTEPKKPSKVRITIKLPYVQKIKAKPKAKPKPKYKVSRIKFYEVPNIKYYTLPNNYKAQDQDFSHSIHFIKYDFGKNYKRHYHYIPMASLDEKTSSGNQRMVFLQKITDKVLIDKLYKKHMEEEMGNYRILKLPKDQKMREKIFQDEFIPEVQKLGDILPYKPPVYDNSNNNMYRSSNLKQDGYSHLGLKRTVKNEKFIIRTKKNQGKIRFKQRFVTSTPTYDHIQIIPGKNTPLDSGVKAENKNEYFETSTSRIISKKNLDDTVKDGNSLSERPIEVYSEEDIEGIGEVKEKSIEKPVESTTFNTNAQIYFFGEPVTENNKNEKISENNMKPKGLLKVIEDSLLIDFATPNNFLEPTENISSKQDQIVTPVPFETPDGYVYQKSEGKTLELPETRKNSPPIYFDDWKPIFYNNTENGFRNNTRHYLPNPKADSNLQESEQQNSNQPVGSKFQNKTAEYSANIDKNSDLEVTEKSCT